jgi:MFS family permease
MDIWGRRNINLIGNIGMVIGWLLITFAGNAAMLISGRIVEGFARSVLATCITVRDILPLLSTKNITFEFTSVTKS